MRVDNDAHKNDVELARKWIYKNSTIIDSTSVKWLCGVKSWTPTRVCQYLCYLFVIRGLIECLEHIFNPPQTAQF